MEKSQPAARKVWPNLKRLCVCNMCQTIAQLSMKLDANPSTHTHTSCSPCCQYKFHRINVACSTQWNVFMLCCLQCAVLRLLMHRSDRSKYLCWHFLAAFPSDECHPFNRLHFIMHESLAQRLKNEAERSAVVQPIAVELSWETFTDREIIIGNRCVPFCSLAPPPSLLSSLPSCTQWN